MRVDVTTEPAQVERLVPAWRWLAATCPAATPFNHPSWVLAWWGNRRDAGLAWRFVTAWGGATGDDRLVGVLPLVRYPDGVVRYAGHDLHDVAGALAGPEALAALWRGVGARLRADGAASGLDLPVIADADRAVLPGAGLAVRSSVDDPAASIALPLSFEAYWASLRPGRRKGMRWERRRLEQDHGAVTGSFSGTRGALGQVDDLWRMRERSWKQRGRYQELVPQARGDRFRSFLRAALGEAEPDGIFEVATVRTGGKAVAMALLLCHGDRLWYYSGTFDPVYAAYGPGRLLLLECVREAIRRHAKVLDLGRGDEPYKLVLGATRRVLHNVTVSV